MISAVLFDLDGTLLDIDLDSFLADYFAALGPVLAGLTGLPTRTALGALQQATNAMFGEHPGLTNRAVFDTRFAELTDVDLNTDEASAIIDHFYAREFPRLQDTHGPHAGAQAAVKTARDLGLRLALATNPIFPRAAVLERLRWAELDPESFDVVTTYETSEACKPLPAYFREVAAKLEVDPVQCLMVGDDGHLDMAAACVEMRTYYVGSDETVVADDRGTIGDLVRLLRELTT